MGKVAVFSPTDELVDQLGGLIASLGINRVAGQLYVLLFLSDKPLSLDEMTRRLRISKGHTSTNIRALERWRAVRKVYVRGSRKDYYQANRNTLTIMLDQLHYGLQQRLEQADIIMESLKAKVEVGQNEDAAALTKRLGEIEGMLAKVHGLVDKLGLVKPLLRGKGNRA